MKTILITTFALGLSSAAFASGYQDAHENLQWQLQKHQSQNVVTEHTVRTSAHQMGDSEKNNLENYLLDFQGGTR
jgi:hypothetical protein